MGSSAVWGLAAATFVASVVEMVEALTIVLAMGMTRSWRSTLWGVAAALVALARSPQWLATRWRRGCPKRRCS